MASNSNFGHFTHGKERAYIEILEQPTQDRVRFRYKCEKRASAPVQGRNSTKQKITYPTIRIHGYRGPATVIVSCVQMDERAHPHKITDKYGNEKCGVFTMKVDIHDDYNAIKFDKLSIQFTKKMDVMSSLEDRENAKVDPFKKGFAHKDGTIEFDVHSVRLAFQATVEILKEGSKIPNRILLPAVASEPISDKKTNLLNICNVSDVVSPANGGKKILLFCDQLERTDLEIQFFEEDINTKKHVLISKVDIPNGSIQVHCQYGIDFLTPPYKNVLIEDPVQVHFRIAKKNSKAPPSNSIAFEYHPVNLAEQMSRKRKRIQEQCSARKPNGAPGGGTQTDSYNIPLTSVNSALNIPVSTPTNIYDTPSTTTNSPFNVTVPAENTIANIKPEFGPSLLVMNNTADMSYRPTTSNRLEHYNMSANQRVQSNQNTAAGTQIYHNNSLLAYQSYADRDSIYMPHGSMFLLPMDPMGLYSVPNFTHENNENFNFNHQFDGMQNQMGAVGGQAECYSRQQQQNVFVPMQQTPSLEAIKQDLMSVSSYNNLN